MTAPAPPSEHNGGVPDPDPQPDRARGVPVGTGQRQRILATALSLMAQHGVDGTSMRTLATATGLNVATLYHYFPSKRDLLVAVLEERGFAAALGSDGAAPPSPAPADDVIGLLDDVLASMLEVEEFVRLMLGEALRGDETARAVGGELFRATQSALEGWLVALDPPPCAPEDAPALARLLRSLLVGIFLEHVAGVLGDGDGVTPDTVFRDRTREAAALLTRHQAR